MGNRFFSTIAIGIGVGFLFLAVFSSVYVLRQKHKNLDTIDPYRASRERSEKSIGPLQGGGMDNLSPEQRKKAEEFLKQSQKKNISSGEEEEFVNENLQLVENPSEEQIEEYITEIKRLAVATDTIKMNGCNPDPVIVKVSQNTALQFVNEEEQNKNIFINNEWVEIPPQTVMEIDAVFASGTGIYNYDCDDYFSVGTLWIIP